MGRRRKEKSSEEQGVRKSLGIALQAIKRLEEIVQARGLSTEEEEDLSIGEDGGPDITVTKKLEIPQQGVVERMEDEEEEIAEEEEYLAMGRDGRP